MRRLVLVLGVLALPSIAWAQAPDSEAYVLGDWNGARTRLHEHGVDVLVTYVNQIAANRRGGERRAASYAGQFMVDANFDLERMADMSGASVHVTVTNRNGVDLNAKAGLGTLLSPQEIYGYGRTTRLAQFYYQQRFGDRATVKLGRLPMSGDVFPFSCAFQNLTFCGAVPGYITPNWFTWPVSQWAAVADVKLADALRLKAAVYQVNPSFLRNDQGLDLGNPSGTTGAHAVGELTWAPRPAGRPAAYRVGLWRNTGDFKDLGPVPDGQDPALRRHASGYYLMAEQSLRRRPADTPGGVSVFANFIRSDQKVSYVGEVWQGGLFWRGPLASRPKDRLGVAVGRLSVSTRSRLRLRQENVTLVPRAEYPVEIFYAWSAGPGVVLRPNVQYTANPGGVTSNRDVVVFGLKSTASF